MRAQLQLLSSDLGAWALRLVELRWWVPPGMVAGVVVARFAGLGVQTLPILAVAILILLYNAALRSTSRVASREPAGDRQFHRFAAVQAGLDSLAVLALVHLTGGSTSPLIFLLFLHVTFAAVLLPPPLAYGFAGFAIGGLAILTGAEQVGLVAPSPLVFGGLPINGSAPPAYTSCILALFAVSVFVSTSLSTAIVKVLRLRLADLAGSLGEIEELNEKLHTLYVVVQSIVSKQRLDQALDIAKTELARVMGVEAVSVKLLSDDRRYLRYAAAHGLPEAIVSNVIDLWKSPLNRQVVLGEVFVTGRLSERDGFQFGEDLVAAGLNSVLFAPLKVDFEVIGVLGAYSRRADRFEEEDVEFFRMAADLVAIAIGNARAYEAVENLMKERSHFLLVIAHNLRAPLGATLSMLDVVHGGLLGELSEKQQEYTARIDRRLRSMSAMINDLLALAKSRAQKRKPATATVDLAALGRKVVSTFEEGAAARRLRLEITADSDVPAVAGDPEMLEQMLENLVSNAIKYTRQGSVHLGISSGPGGAARIEVRDTGMGIPKESMGRLFTEFYRAPNARSVEAVGTGLGLALVKATVDQHGGQITVESEEDRGTSIVIQLPAADVAAGVQQCSH